MIKKIFDDLLTNEKKLRLCVFIFAVLLHVGLLFFIVVKTQTVMQAPEENARIMKLTDFEELIPKDPEVPIVEAIAEEMIETDTEPVQEVLAAGVFITENYLPMHQLSTPPKFDENGITQDLVYPPIALRGGVEGRVILELFVDFSGTVQKIMILREDPPEKGFGEAAVKAFEGRKGVPAFANGEPVSARYRYPVSFRIK
jgi:protein TonB